MIHRKHSLASGEEECLCSFILCWKHGPNADTYMEKKVENICIVQSNVKLNPIVALFAKRARERIEGADHKHISASNGDSATCNSSAGCRENSSPIVKQKSTFAQRLMQVSYFVYGDLELPMYNLLFGATIDTVFAYLQGKCAKQSTSSIQLCEGLSLFFEDSTRALFPSSFGS